MTGDGAAPADVAQIRADGCVFARLAQAEGRPALADLREAGGFRLKFPRPADPAAPEAVIVNTGGGMTGGDALAARFEVDAGASLTVTTQSAEKIYRSDGPATRVTTQLRVGAGARLSWLPQETILFDGARLMRAIEADIDPDGALTLIEPVIFGRLARGERLGQGLFRDSWRLRRGGSLIHAEETRLDGPIADLLDRPAIGAGARAMLLALRLAPAAERLVDPARAALAGASARWGVSGWDGLILARALGDPPAIRALIAPLMTVFQAGVPSRLW